MPGMFVRVRLVTSDPYKALLVPETAIMTDQGQHFVFVVTDKNIMERRDVNKGDMEDDGMRVVEEGLTADDWVIDLPRRTRNWGPGTTVRPLKPPVAVSPSSLKNKSPAPPSKG